MSQNNQHIPGGNELTTVRIIPSIPKFDSDLPGVSELKQWSHLSGGRGNELTNVIELK